LETDARPAFKERLATSWQNFLHWIVYVAVRLVSVALHAFPVDLNLQTAKLLGNIMYAIDKKHRDRAMANLRRSFPEKSEAECQALARRSMQQMVMLFVEVLFTTRLIRVDTWNKYVQLENFHDVQEMLLRRERGMIMLTGHYGNWEVLGYTIAAMGFQNYAVARPIDNPYVDSWLLGVREKRGQIILSKRGVTTTALDVLEKKGIIGFIADQNAGPKGMFVPFFGRLASTYKSIGLLAIQHDVPVIVGYARRRNDHFQFDIGAQDIIYPDDWKNYPRGQYDNELHYITARYTRGIEDFVRADPTQYLWIHRRWKTRPKSEKPGEVKGVG